MTSSAPRRVWRHAWLISCGLLLLAATGCWMPGSSGAIQTPVAQNLPTLTPVPSETPIPTITDTLEPTIDLEAQLAETEEVTPSLTPTEEAPGVTLIAQLPTDPDPLIQGATDFVATITQEVIDQTLTAEQEFNPIATDTATPESFVPTFTATPQAPLPGNNCVHEVRTGENLFRLSLLYGVPIRDIANASGVANINMIVVGQKLTIPGCGTTGAIPPATSIPSDTRAADGTTTDTSGSFTSAGGVEHIVQQGETLFQISLQYGVPVRAIADRNGIANINLIYIEQKLIIP